MPKASVVNNGLISDQFEIKRGTAHESPLLPLLLSLAIEPLAIAVCQTPGIKKLQQESHTLTDPICS